MEFYKLSFYKYDNDLNQINFLKLKNNIEIEKNVIIIF